jgi:predicted dehydrogenase
MIDAGIVGLGWWGKNLIEAVQGKSNRLRFVRGACRDIKPVATFAERHGLALSSSLIELLADENVEAVVLATPHSLHAEQIIVSAEARKPVFCEKPLALTRDDAARAIDACRRHGVVLALGENNRFWPNTQEILRIVASGELGESMHIEGHASNENSGRFFGAWRHLAAESPGGGMTGAGIHVLDAFIRLMGPVQSVSAQLVSRKSPPDPIDMLSAEPEHGIWCGGAGKLVTVCDVSRYVLISQLAQENIFISADTAGFADRPTESARSKWWTANVGTEVAGAR